MLKIELKLLFSFQIKEDLLYIEILRKYGFQNKAFTKIAVRIVLFV